MPAISVSFPTVFHGKKKTVYSQVLIETTKKGISKNVKTPKMMSARWLVRNAPRQKQNSGYYK